MLPKSNTQDFKLGGKVTMEGTIVDYVSAIGVSFKEGSHIRWFNNFGVSALGDIHPSPPEYPYMLNDRPLKINDKVMILVKPNIWEPAIIEELQMDEAAWCATVRWPDDTKEDGVLPEDLMWLDDQPKVEKWQWAYQLNTGYLGAIVTLNHYSEEEVNIAYPPQDILWKHKIDETKVEEVK